jgi:hypothetical protein
MFITFPSDDDLLHGDSIMTEFQLIHLCANEHTHTQIILGTQMDKYIDFLPGKVFVRSVHHMLEHSFIIKTVTYEYFYFTGSKTRYHSLPCITIGIALGFPARRGTGISRRYVTSCT